MTEHKHTNRLINETSPYLLQHAHNPVDWYAWGEEALQQARKQNKPILLSIGYSACHWCHVMEHESFENEEIARIMNENFINIKVDREERPDLDHIYMSAVQMMTRSGGWPMTVFLTPEGEPFYAGTYFPPEDRYNMPGFPRILLGVAEAYRLRPTEVQSTAQAVVQELRGMSSARESRQILTTDLLDSAYKSILRGYDSLNGGFGAAPKFPPAMTLEFLMRFHHRTGRSDALEVVEHTCRKMAEGGMYDQLGGGFHRYSTDSIWLVPHFEKMLYDNALLSRLYLHLYQQTGNDFYRRIAEETLDYVLREMTSLEGGFYSTQDADSEGHEGKFFVWTKGEIDEALNEDEARAINAYYGVTAEGNFEGANILHVARAAEEVGAELGIETSRVLELIASGRKKLFELRETRVKPARDEKILTGWNGLMLASFAEAGAVLESEGYLSAARKNADFVLSNLRRNGLLLRTYKDGVAKLNAYLEDYSFMASGLVALYESTGELRWLKEASEIVERMIEEFWDENDGGFFYTGKSHEALIVRAKDFYDNATPSGNSVAAETLLRLGFLTGEERYGRMAVSIFRLMRDSMERLPTAFSRLLCGLDLYLSTPKEIAVVGRRADRETSSLLREVWRSYLPNKIVALQLDDDAEAGDLVPLLKDRKMKDEQAIAYVCENCACMEPATTAEALRAQLTGQIAKPAAN